MSRCSRFGVSVVVDGNGERCGGAEHMVRSKPGVVDGRSRWVGRAGARNLYGRRRVRGGANGCSVAKHGRCPSPKKKLKRKKKVLL
jgi:hypothetical protein